MPKDFDANIQDKPDDLDDLDNLFEEEQGESASDDTQETEADEDETPEKRQHTFHLPMPLSEAVRRIAFEQDRTQSSVVEELLRAGLEAQGLLKG